MSPVRTALPQKKPKGLAPTYGPGFAGVPLATSLLRGHAAKGHPWPFAALAASMPLNPLRKDSTRPAEGAIDVAC